MSTIKEIASLANVSPATVSNVLNNRNDQVSSETRERVLAVIKEANFKPNRIAKSLRINRSHTIGVIAEDITVFNTPSTINGINAFVEQNHYRIILNDLGLHRRIGHNFHEIVRFQNSIDRSLDVLSSFQVDGMIYIGLHPRDVTGVVTFSDRPVVYVGCSARGAPSILYDDKAAFYEATCHLLDLGHRRIVLLAGSADSAASGFRLEGYKKALEEYALPYSDDLIIFGDWDYASGYTMGKSLTDCAILPTAVLAMNDLMAMGAVEAIRELGMYVPEDISVIGFDDREFCRYTSPRLTTVQLPLYEMGYKAASTLIALIDKEEVPSSLNLPCQLTLRNSTGPIFDN